MMKDAHNCSKNLKLLGDYWTLRIINALRSGEQRFCQLQRDVDNPSPTTLTDRLKNLEAMHLISRSEETQSKISVTYSLTNHGREVLPIIDAIKDFPRKTNVTVP